MNHNTDNSIPLPTGNTDSLPLGDAPGATHGGPSPSSSPLPSGDERGQPPAPSPSNNNQALIDGLRALADFLEQRPQFPAIDLAKSIAEVSFMASSREEIATVIRAMERTEKTRPNKPNDWRFEARRSFGPVSIVVWTFRDCVCRKVKKMKMVEVWECDDSILKAMPQKSEAF